ncbi:hypothetical protein ACFCVU_03900 [Peribacillus butanolivorans]|uniref:hypothetical protein n=1 Tax=Peribacillus butanolivorans TaxID=421767 RepID=UPI0035DB094B
MRKIFEKSSLVIYNLEEKQAFATWVADCWKKADGQAITLPAYFSLHDDYESFDLKKN